MGAMGARICLCPVGQSYFAMVNFEDMDGLYRFAISNVFFKLVTIIEFDLHKLGNGSNHHKIHTAQLIYIIMLYYVRRIFL